jgi:hypothetical protein
MKSGCIHYVVVVDASCNLRPTSGDDGHGTVLPTQPDSLDSSKPRPPILCSYIPVGRQQYANINLTRYLLCWGIADIAQGGLPNVLGFSHLTTAHIIIIITANC